ncbi:MAG: biopolymer transporter ExbD [Ignavibacteria bacterium]|nr:biopolymer transporter ExbD [Ignavibacteria bacterium]
MAVIKKPRVAIRIDMTPFVDIAFLLLTFFMLTTQFKPPEEVVIELPFSHSEIKLPESDVMLVYLTKDGQIWLSLDAQKTRTAVLTDIVRRDWDTYKPETKQQYGSPEIMAKLAPSVRVTINDLPDLLIKARITNAKLRTVIKGDVGAEYGLAEDVMNILQKTKISRFSLVTNFEHETAKQ